jgi:hypothetical protein
MPLSRTRPRDHGVLTDCPTEPPRACTFRGRSPENRESHVARVDSAEPRSGTKLLRVPTRCCLSDANSLGKVPNVCGDSSAIGESRSAMQSGS